MAIQPKYVVAHLAWIPTLLVLFKVYYRDRYPIPAGLLAYFLGSVATVPAWGLQVLWGVFWGDAGWAVTFEMPLWLVPVEEVSKLAVAWVCFKVLGCQSCRSFIPLAISAALGFGVTESGLAIMISGYELLPLRLLVSVPGHVLFTATAAVGVAGCRGPGVGLGPLVRWGMLAIALHSAYNHVVVHGDGVTGLAVMGWLAGIGVLICLLALVRLRGPVDSSVLPKQDGVRK